MNRESRLKRLKEGKNQTFVSSIPRDRVTAISEGTELRVRKSQASQTQVATLSKPPLKSQSKPTSLRRSQPAKSLAGTIGWQVLRIVIISIGLSAIAGTLIYFWQSAVSRTITAPIGNQIGSDKKDAPSSTDLTLKAELTALTAKIKQLAAPEPDLSIQTLVFDADTGVYADVNGRKPIAAASIIKIPLLIAFLQDVDEGKAQLGERLEISKDVIVGEAGGLQYEPAGTKISALETLTEMIVHSDNTATNMIMKKIGGKDAANRRFKSWGLTSTVIRNPLPDLEGTNTTSPYDLVNLLSMVDKGKLLSPRSRDRLMDIMRRPVTNTLLPQGIAPDARIVHKTGDIRSVVGDAGIIDMPSGRRYIMAAIVKRPDNDQRANELIRKVSRATYDYLKTNNSNSSPNSVSNPVRNFVTNPVNNSIDSTIQSPDTPIAPSDTSPSDTDTSNVNDSDTSSVARSQQNVVNTQP
jgi:beta-lactamase class A